MSRQPGALRLVGRLYADLARKYRPPARIALLQVSVGSIVLIVALLVVTATQTRSWLGLIPLVLVIVWQALWSITLFRTGDVPARGYLKLHAMRDMFNDFGAAPDRGPEPPPCEGASAFWCPHCGDCTCEAPEDRLDDNTCPLHGPGSDHAEPNSPGNYARANWRYPNDTIVSNPGQRGCLRWHVHLDGIYVHADDDTPCDISNGPNR